MRAATLAAAFLALSGTGGQDVRRSAKDHPKHRVFRAHTWKQAYAEASNRNVPIFIAFHQDGSEGCDAMAALYRDRKFIETSRMWVNVVAHPGSAHAADV